MISKDTEINKPNIASFIKIRSFAESIIYIAVIVQPPH